MEKIAREAGINCFFVLWQAWDKEQKFSPRSISFKQNEIVLNKQMALQIHTSSVNWALDSPLSLVRD